MNFNYIKQLLFNQSLGLQFFLSVFKVYNNEIIVTIETKMRNESNIQNWKTSQYIIVFSSIILIMILTGINVREKIEFAITNISNHE